MLSKLRFIISRAYKLLCFNISSTAHIEKITCEGWWKYVQAFAIANLFFFKKENISYHLDLDNRCWVHEVRKRVIIMSLHWII